VKVLFYSPYANIWAHSFPEALIAEGLVQQGDQVTVVRCGRMLESYCVAMSAATSGATDLSPARRAQICRACIRRRDLLDGEMPYRSLILDDLLSADDEARARQIVATATPENWPGIDVGGIPIGRYAAYEYLLNHKLLGTHIPPERWAGYLDQLRQSLLVLFAAERLIAQEQPDRVVVSNRLYSAHHTFVAVAERGGIDAYTLQGGGHVVRRGETMTMYRGTSSVAEALRSPAWRQEAEVPLDAASVDLVAEHIGGLLTGTSAFAYSSGLESQQPADVRAKFGVRDGSPVLLVAMSSEDELNALRLADGAPQPTNEISLFPGQFEWIDFLLEFAKRQPELTFIIRVHPRLFPNKRDSVRSPAADLILAKLQTVPENVVLNVPDDDVSLYDLMQIVDVTLGFRTSVGVEFASFGTPVVIPANAEFFTYPDEINLIGHSIAEYEAKIGEALAAGWSLDHSRRAFRWLAFLFGRLAVDLSESMSSRPMAIRPTRPGLRLAVWKAMVYVVLQFGPLVIERRALRARRFPAFARRLFRDVLLARRENLADSPLWPARPPSAEEEQALLVGYLRGLTDTIWADIDDPRSLTARIRDGLARA